ncbi:MAG: hypothetical protein U0414_16815 [Polyangiaceae bacterium]
MADPPKDEPDRKDEAPVVETNAAALRTADGTTSVNTLSPPSLFVRGTFLDPIGGKSRALPPHTWTLTKAGDGAILFGSDSDGTGLSTITLALDGDLKSRWVLAWRPILAGDAQLASNEIWVDLDAIDTTSTLTPRPLLSSAWVTGPKPKDIETRRLVRLVVMDSKAKLSTSGFEVVAGVNEPDGTPGKEFPTTDLGADGHLLERAFVYLLGKHGTPSKPWELQVDFNWFTTWIAFQYFDLAARHTRVVPPGIVVFAKDKTGKVVGAGVTMDSAPLGEGNKKLAPIYVVHQRLVEQSKDVQYVFELPEQTVVDLEGMILDSEPRTVKTVGTVSPDLRLRYRLPAHWHSHGMRCSNRNTGELKKVVVLEEWDGVVTDPEDPIRVRATWREGPLRFHLDDTLLVDEQKNIVALSHDKNFVTVFDQQLIIRSPLAGLPHVTVELEKDDNYFYGPEYIVVEGGERATLTRLFHYEGTMFSMREARRTGPEGTTKCLGARVAIANDHERVDRRQTGVRIKDSVNFHGKGRYQLHLIDTVIDDWVYLTSLVKLTHLVITFTSFVDRGDTEKDPTTLTFTEVDAVLLNLDDAARRWSAGHPSSPALAKKAYALVPLDEPLREVVLTRYYFGHHHKPKGGSMRILLHKKIRANADSATSTVHLQVGDAVASGGEAEDLDGLPTTRSVMAHEFGHMLGLPDEYLEGTKESDVLPSINQPLNDGGPARPFVGDRIGLMEGMRSPRLRYLWHHAHALNNEPALAGALGNRTFVPQHWPFASSTYTGGLTYKLPATPPFKAPADPWMPVDRRVMHEHKRVELFLYQLGEDEGAAGGVAGSSSDLVGSGDTPLTALVLARVHFDLKAAPKATKADLIAAGRAIQTLIGPNSIIPAFALRGDGLPFPRALVFFQFGYAFAETAPAPAVRLLIEPAASTVANDLLKLEAAKPKVLHVKAAECTWALVRYALGMESSAPSTTGAPASLDAPLGESEIPGSNFEAEVAALLKDPSPKRAWRFIWMNGVL